MNKQNILIPESLKKSKLSQKNTSNKWENNRLKVDSAIPTIKAQRSNI